MKTRLNELSVREPGRNAGGDLVDAYFPPSSDTLAGKSTALLFVHGYNNSHDAARGAYEQFILDLEDAIGRAPLPWPVFGVQWPGDEDNGILSALEYSGKVPVSRNAATRIFALLGQVGGTAAAPTVLHVAAHSLGARLTGQLLKLIADHAPRFNVVIGRVILMAAAIPVGHVEAKGDLRHGFDATGGVCVLHSTGDEVLHFLFPLGQTLARDGFFPTAVGRFGDPRASWGRQQRMFNDQGTYNHGDYWKGLESAAEAARWLGAAVESTISAVQLDGRSLPAANVIQERTFTARAVGQRE